MASTTLPKRTEIAREYLWNDAALFSTADAWKIERQSIIDNLPALKAFQGHLGDDPAVLADAMHVMDDLVRRSGRVVVYASMSHAVDTADQKAAAMYSEAQTMLGQVLAVISFLDPELLAIGPAKLHAWIQTEPRLAIYGHYADDLFRKQAHVRSVEVEELLGLIADPFAGISNTATLLTDADMKFESAIDKEGSKLAVSHGTLSGILNSGDRPARQSAWESYMDKHLAFKNTLASTLGTSIKQSIWMMHVRRHSSSLDASLFENNVPTNVFHNLIDVFRRNLPTWHRYWALRRKALKVEQLEPYDIWAPLTDNKPDLPYRQAVEWICQGLSPLGTDYVKVVRNGCLNDRWVDVYPNQGKTAGAFSAGLPGTLPYILMSYNDDLESLSMLAHELGHSMHTYLTCETQPVIYSRYSMFVAETASNFHQAMVRASLFEQHPDTAFQISLIQEAMSNFHRYFFIMPTLARFELETHQRAEQGKGLTADSMIELMADLFSEGYGGEMHVDRERVGITWATFGHLYSDYYVYQYATGISAANALCKRILSGNTDAVGNYLSFLRAGGSLYPLDALKMAGIDMTTPEPIEVAFDVLKGIIDRLEQQLSTNER